ncbi:MAG: aminoglycoside phosphotransferase family protein [Dysgonamonadaceae bacterium]|jgi:Ser/Thr protein kinase RdoA (MazF antagonist)|nr:aminoglycoside phosphotransferase family protein [Dysgonamonadaceae bacterium]
MNHLIEIASHFELEGKVLEIIPFGNGLINESYRVKTEGNAPDYVLQRINHAIFRDVDLLQNNIEAVTLHIRKKLMERGELDVDRKVLRFIPANNGRKYYFDETNYWRISVLIPRSVTYEQVDEEYSRYAGLAFGDFQQMLSDIPGALGETIPNFHNMEFRLQQFREAVAANPEGRAASVQYYIDEIEKRSVEMCKAERLHREGKLPKRICHCDTKVNNILFDENGEILCVIDLDTVMPSFIFSDAGDFLRTAANTGLEDEADLNRVNFNVNIFKAFTGGYLQSAKGFLTETEIENLPYAATLFPYMQCVRFFADYLNGDTYYKIQYPEHNLVRTKAQFKLLQSAEAAMPELKRITESNRSHRV